MQIQNNYESSPNFGMALKITPKAAKAMQKASRNALEELQQIGKDLQDTKYYHLEIGKNLTPRITAGSQEVCVPPFTITEPKNNILSVSAAWDRYFFLRNLVAEPDLYLQFSNKAQATKAYNKLNKMNERQQAAELVKLLDKQRNDMIAKGIAAKKEKEEAAKLADNLINEFGAAAGKNPVKKFFSKLFAV